MVVEVADSSLAYDRNRKGPYYAKSGIREYWVVDLDGDRLIVMREPGPEGYATVQSLGRGDRVHLTAVPEIQLEVSDMLPPQP